MEYICWLEACSTHRQTIALRRGVDLFEAAIGHDHFFNYYSVDWFDWEATRPFQLPLCRQVQHGCPRQRVDEGHLEGPWPCWRTGQTTFGGIRCPLDGARDETYLLWEGIGAMGLDHGDDWMAETLTVDDPSNDGVCGGTHRHVGSAVGAMGQRRQCPGWQRPGQGGINWRWIPSWSTTPASTASAAGVTCAREELLTPRTDNDVVLDYKGPGRGHDLVSDESGTLVTSLADGAGGENYRARGALCSCEDPDSGDHS